MELRTECENWMKAIDDKGFIPEEALIRQFWPNKKQPITSNPIIKEKEGHLQLSCSTGGAAIGYKFSIDNNPALGWKPYTEPIEVPKGTNLRILAHRIGYLPSDTLYYTVGKNHKIKVR